ncbi:MAG: hypothetical protein LBS96_05595 [Oscillospiraceae bacterium]|nr:hypothetical protein [Oscillospiraceae bacterium]
MSMPQLPAPDPCLTKEQALHMILASIAMEETALSHILNAEGEKIQFALADAQRDDCYDYGAHCRILEINRSAQDVIGKITDMQIVLKEKMKQAIDSLPKSPEPWPSPPVQQLPACNLPYPPALPQPYPPVPLFSPQSAQSTQWYSRKPPHRCNHT